MIPAQPNWFFWRIFHKYLTCFCLKNLLISTIHIRYGMMLFIMCHFTVIELAKAISFSIIFTFRIPTERLFKFMNIFSLDLYAYSLNINKRWFINTLLFLKMEPSLAESRISKKAVGGGFFFFCQGLLSRTMATQRTAGEGRGPSFIPLYHSHPLTNIQAFIYNFACEITITYF